MHEDLRRPSTRNRRFEFIEWKLFWEGHLNRSDLETQFGISTPQASVDLKNYREVAGENIEYDTTGKAYVSSDRLAPRFLQPSADRILLQLRALLSSALPRRDLWFRNLPPIDAAPDLVRHVDPHCLRLVLRAIRTHSGIDVQYRSLTNVRWRRIAPHALAFDGHRWHLRAWACDRDDFRDFVLSRISEFGEIGPVSYDPGDDIEWNTRTTLLLRPHPGLTPDQSLAIQRDYEMVDGSREVEVRLSMAYYFIKRMNLDIEHLPPTRAQLYIENLSEVDAAIAAAREERRIRVARRALATKG